MSEETDAIRTWVHRALERKVASLNAENARMFAKETAVLQLLDNPDQRSAGGSIVRTLATETEPAEAEGFAKMIFLDVKEHRLHPLYAMILGAVMSWDGNDR